MSEVLDALTTLKDNGLADSAVQAVCNDLLDADEFEDCDDRKLVALCAHLDGETDITVCKYDDCIFESGRAEYLVCDEDETESRIDDSLESLLDDGGCVEGADSPYFDRERWKRDARMDGAGHILSSYDGSEWDCAEFSIFRVN
jgi:hypothetical protein